MPILCCEANMHIPKTGEQVFVHERQSIFTVALVYQETQTADLVPVGRGRIEEDVPWRKLLTEMKSS